VQTRQTRQKEGDTSMLPSSKSVLYSRSWCPVLPVSVWIHRLSASKGDERAGLWGSRYRPNYV
jgi:hypothetical protein